MILSRGMHSSTFLPQVWEQLPDKEQFLEYLYIKRRHAANCMEGPID